MSELERLKKQYEEFRRRYKLPPFSQLNEDFEIEKLQEAETEFLLRGIRRTMMEKIVAIMRFFELILNPVAAEAPAPMFVFALLKEIKPEIRKLAEQIYKEFAVYEVLSVNLDIEYNEKEEAKFIADIAARWQQLKTDLKRITKSLSATWEVKEKERGYFG
jgi:hypothetical protein